MSQERKTELSELSTPVYSCLTECPTIPQKTVPLATPMETVLAPGAEELRGKRERQGSQREWDGRGPADTGRAGRERVLHRSLSSLVLSWGQLHTVCRNDRRTVRDAEPGS